MVYVSVQCSETAQCDSGLADNSQMTLEDVNPRSFNDEQVPRRAPVSFSIMPLFSISQNSEKHDGCQRHV